MPVHKWRMSKSVENDEHHLFNESDGVLLRQCRHDAIILGPSSMNEPDLTPLKISNKSNQASSNTLRPSTGQIESPSTWVSNNRQFRRKTQAETSCLKPKFASPSLMVYVHSIRVIFIFPFGNSLLFGHSDVPACVRSIAFVCIDSVCANVIDGRAARQLAIR